MPNTKGAKKRLGQNVVRRDRNKVTRSRMRSMLRKFREAVAAKDFEQAKECSRLAAQMLDKAASKGVIHRNKAARLKSRMSHNLIASQAA